MKQRLSLIWAMSRNRVIGKDGGLPWRLPDELGHFRRTTRGKPVIMGRRTFESAGHPLSGRLNVVLSRRGFVAEGARAAATLDDAIAIAAEDPANECFVIGGAEPYALALPRADRLYGTTVEAKIEGDTLFPPFDPEDWRLVRCAWHGADGRHAFAYTIRVYDRQSRAPTDSA